MTKNILSKYLFGMLSLGLLASCSNDFNPDGDKILENESTTYVRVSLMGEGNGTRAEAEYENGSGDESAVSSILLTFFDAGRNYVGSTTINVNDAEKVEFNGDEDKTVERFLTVVAPVTLPENINYPKYVIAYVNPTSASGDLALDKLEDVMKVIRNRSTVSPTGYRTMNNSVYYSEQTNYTRFATEIDFSKQFFNTMEEAKDANADATINITVERMEAKVRVNTPLKDINVKPVENPDGNDGEVSYSLEFVPEAWFVNGTEKRSFLIKNYRSTRENYLIGHADFPSTDFGMPLNKLQDAFKANNTSGNRWTEINNEACLRSFWAIDPTYFIEGSTEGLYPDVSYDVKYTENDQTINPGTENDPTISYPLQYRSYSNVKKEWNAAKSTSYVKFNENVKTHEYVLENTMSLLTLNSTKAMASMTSVVVLGHYMITNKSGEVVFDGSTLDKSKSFYIRHDGEGKNSVMLSDKDAINFFLERGGSTLFVQTVDKDGNPVENAYEPLRAGHLKDGKYGVSYDDFELVYPKASITNGVKLSEQWRTLMLKKKNGVYNSNIYVYDAAIDNGAGGYKPVSSIENTEMSALNTRLYSTYGLVERFNSGKAYFNIPLKHIWGVNKGKFEASKVVLGDYGVVRNHIYDLTINTITGMGTGIGDPDQPIVPPTENDQYYISTRLNILQWRLVKQTVDL